MGREIELQAVVREIAPGFWFPGDAPVDLSANRSTVTAQGGLTTGTGASLIDGGEQRSTEFDGSNDYLSTTYLTEYAAAESLGQLDAETFPYKVLRLSDGSVLIGTEPNGKVFRSTDGGRTRTLVATNLGGAAGIHDMIECTPGVVIAALTNGKVARSTDYGLTWDGGTALGDAERVNALVYTSTGVLLAGTRKAGAGGKVFRSTDVGVTYDAGTASFSTGNQGVNVFVDIGGGVVMMGGFDDIAVNWYRTTDAGGASGWTQMTLGSGLLGTGEYPHCGANLSGGVAVIGTYGGSGASHLYLTIDSGVNWTVVHTSVGIQGFFWIEAMGNGVVLAGSGINPSSCRLYISRNNGQSFAVLQDGIGAASTHVLSIERLGYGEALITTGTDGLLWSVKETGPFVTTSEGRTFMWLAERGSITSHDSLFGGSGSDADYLHGNPALVIQPTTGDLFFMANTYFPAGAWAAAVPAAERFVGELYYDGVTAELWINGKTQGAIDYTVPFSPNPGALKIGAYGPGSSLPFDGQMQHLVVVEGKVSPGDRRAFLKACRVGVWG